MKHRKKQLFTLLCGLLLILAACGPKATPAPPPTATPPPEPVELTWLVRYDVVTEIEAEKQIIADFQASHPGITIRQKVFSLGAYYGEFSAMQKAGTPADIWVPSWAGGLKTMVVKDLPLDLTPLIERDQLDLADFMPQVLDYHKDGGKIMGIPFLVGGAYLFYNKDLFDQAGVAYPPTDWGDTSWDWAAFREKCLALNKISEPFSVKTDHFGAQIISSPTWDPWYWGQDPFPESAYETGFAEEAYYDSPGMIEGVQAYQDLMHVDGCIPDMEEMNMIYSGGDPFALQRLAMYQDGVWMMVDYRNITDFRWGAAALPYAGEGRKGLIYTDAWAIAKDSKHPEEAWTFLKYLASAEAQLKWLQITGFPPARQSLLEAWYQEYPTMQPEELKEVFLGSLEYGHQTQENLLVDYARIETTLTTIINAPILYNQKNAAEVLPLANEAVVEMLKKIKAEYGK